MFADKDVGKKTLTGFLEKVFDENYGSIIGVDFCSKNIEIKGKTARLQLWICSDKEDARETYYGFIKGSNGVILMYDITNSRSLDFLSKALQDVNKAREKYDFPLLLVGNKLDLEEQREVTKDQVEKFKENGEISSSMEISLKTGENVEKMFKKLTEMIEGEELDENDFSFDPINTQKPSVVVTTQKEVIYMGSWISEEMYKQMCREYVKKTFTLKEIQEWKEKIN